MSQFEIDRQIDIMLPENTHSVTIRIRQECTKERRMVDRVPLVGALGRARFQLVRVRFIHLIASLIHYKLATVGLFVFSTP